jgi:hypothetical protein
MTVLEQRTFKYKLDKDGSIVDQYGAILYESENLNGFPRKAKIRLAKLHTADPTLNWEGNADVKGAWDILIDEGYLSNDHR